MNPDRWGQIKQIYHSALELEPGRREEFLREACAGDTSLLKEVTSLLAQDRSPDGILQRPALEVVAQESGEGKEHKALLAGRTLLHYRIEEKIGQGGMGEVYRARDTSLDRTVALKILPAAFVSDQDRMRRFEREAKAASALSHQNVATIFGVGQAEGVHFIAMEYVSGETLGEYSRNRKLEPGQIFDIAIQMADTLEEAQAKGVIHRDLKPANVMVTARGQVKVLDFGLAKLARPAGEPGETSPSSLTESGLVIGTVAYMSPEQVLGRRLDHHTDIFSLGTILYELATGHSPFAGRTTTEMMDRILHAEPEPIARFNPRVPPEFERIVRKCLEKDSERRYQSARELQIDLQNLKRELEPRAQGVHAPRRSFVPAWIPGIVAAVILTVIGGWYWMNRQPRVEPEAELRPVPLTSYPGFEHTPSFSPDGTQVAFQWYPQGPRANCDIWVKQIGVEPPFRLTT
ncbi:MAG: serine/threonine protein kinase, partial [Acidobacteria bacterium]